MIVESTKDFILRIESSELGYIPVIGFKYPVGNEGTTGNTWKTLEQALIQGREILNRSQEKADRCPKRRKVA